MTRGAVAIHSSLATNKTCDALCVVLTVLRNGVLEYWGAEEFGRPPAGAVSFKFKMDTDLYDLAKAKARPCSISFSPDGKSMAVTARDKQVPVGNTAFAWRPVR